MAKKVTLETLAKQMAEGFAKQGKEIHDLTESVGFVVKHMATKEDMATKDQIIALHTQVNSIETELRSMKHTKLHARVANLEEKVFGETRA
jgi:hemerythrin superfamily protein